MADFVLVAKRTLNEADYRLFRYHFLLGADWKLCCQQLNVDRGTFFHLVYRIEERLGRVFRELQPYALFPLDEYFGGSARKLVDDLPDPERTGGNVIQMPDPARIAAKLAERAAKRATLRPPLRKAA